MGYRAWGGRGAVIGWSLLVVSLLLGPALAVFTRLTVGYYVPLSERYGLSLHEVAVELIRTRHLPPA